MAENTRLAPRFPLGPVVATPGALDALEEAGEDARKLLRRHITGDWGDVCEEDAAENKLSVEKGFRIMSVYTLSTGVKVWLIEESNRSATTFLLELPELLEVVADWDSYVRARLPEGALWYSRLDYRGCEAVPTYGNGLRMRGTFRKPLKEMCERAGIPHMSPHKLRHGHVEYALGQAKTVDQLKAISLNVMHGNLSTTDGIYGIFHERDVEAWIRALGSSEGEGLNGLGTTDQAAVIEQLTEILHKLRNGGGRG